MDLENELNRLKGNNDELSVSNKKLKMTEDEVVE